MVFAPHAWSRWTALLAAACLFLLIQTRLAGTVAGASLEVRSVPAGAEVRVDGAPVGQSNCLQEGLRSGTVEVEVRRAGYLAARQRVQLERGQTSLVVFSLEPQPVEVSLKVEGPSRFKVELGPGSARREESPKKLRLEPGLYDLSVSAEGYKSVRRKLEVRASTPATVKLTMSEVEPPPPAPTPRPVFVAPRPAPAYVPSYTPPPPRYYAPPPRRYYPPPPVYQPRFTPIPAVPGQPIMTPL